jgi:multiple sugar transport system ATP-binding protein
MVARLSEASRIGEGDEAELWLDNGRVHLFDPESGDNLAAAASGNGARAS